MPVYEYQCKACHKEFEYQQRMSDPEKTTCETCGGSLERMLSVTAVQAKGGVWQRELAAASCGPAGCAPVCGPSAGSECGPCGPVSSAGSGGCSPSGGCGM